MGMFCYQCQETAGNKGCTIKGVCGKTEETAGLQDLLIFTLKGMALYGDKLAEKGKLPKSAGRFMAKALFATITNANFDEARISELIFRTLREKALLRKELGDSDIQAEEALWSASEQEELFAKIPETGILQEKDEDRRSLKELITYGIKGIAAYTEHAAVLGSESDKIYGFIMEALASITKELSMEELTALVLKTGEYAVEAMKLLDSANTGTFGHPEITNVNIGTGKRPGILVSGHDLKDLEMLLIQSEGKGVDIYTHSEMLPANYYPAFKKFSHFHGNYGNAWWKQNREFESFNGPVLMTTNCIVPVKDSYRDRIFTTGMAGYPGIPHIDSDSRGFKNFSSIIELAQQCSPPEELETGSITGGFAHNQVSQLADKVVGAINSGAIKQFVVMGGCDGRQKGRNYYTEFAEALPEEAVILTAGCAKYRYNKLDLGSIGDIPRVLDAGQCNDSYSLVMTALKLKEAMGAADINDLPISYNIAWYEQKAVTVLLALLYLGVRGIRLGPTLPAFLTENIINFLIKEFDIKPVENVEADITSIHG